jgi:diacylglycerol kinase (ATP)
VTGGTHLLVNLRARRIARGERVLAVLRAAAADGCILHETHDLAQLEERARAIAEAKARAIVLAGGDGAYMAGLTALRRAYGAVELPPIALAPGGTVSTVARNFGLRGDAARFTERVLRAARAPDPPTRNAQTLRVTDDAGGDRTGFIFGAGLVARFFGLYEADGSRGYFGAARIVARIFASSFIAGATSRRVLTPARARIAIDGATQPASAYSLIAAATVKDLGLSMRLTYRASEDPDRVHVVASPLGPRALGPQMPLVLMGKRLRGEGHVDALARHATVELMEERGAYVLDGDVFHAQRIELRAGRAIRLVTV